MIQDTVNALAVPHAREIAGKLAGKILNVLGMDWVGISQVLCPCPCDVLAVYQPGILALAPSVIAFLLLLRRTMTAPLRNGEDGPCKRANKPSYNQEGILALTRRVPLRFTSWVTSTRQRRLW